MNLSEKVLEKIQKCLNLSKSANAGEAANALRQAHALMKKYGLTAAQVNLSEVKKVTREYHKNRANLAWENAFFCLIQNVFSVRVLVQTYTKYYPAEMIFYGINSQAEVAAYVYEVLMRQLMLDRRHFVSSLPKQLSRKKKTEQADLYCEAWVCAVMEKVKDLYQKRDSRIDQIIALEKPGEVDVKRRTLPSRSIRDTKTIEAGLKDGAEADVFMGVNKNKNSSPNLIAEPF